MSFQDFNLIPDEKGLFLDVKYPTEDKPRYTINLMKMECTCTGQTIEIARAVKEKRPVNIVCKHLKEVEFRIHHAGVRLGRVRIKEWEK